MLLYQDKQVGVKIKIAVSVVSGFNKLELDIVHTYSPLPNNHAGETENLHLPSPKIATLDQTRSMRT